MRYYNFNENIFAPDFEPDTVIVKGCCNWKRTVAVVMWCRSGIRFSSNVLVKHPSWTMLCCIQDTKSYEWLPEGEAVKRYYSYKLMTRCAAPVYLSNKLDTICGYRDVSTRWWTLGGTHFMLPRRFYQGN